jgi:drug/metabolite transporter (DMT)-like permease
VPRGALGGILLMLAAVGFFAGLDAFLKLLAGHYPPLQVSALRGAASLPFVVLPLLVSGRLRELRPVRWGLQLVRGLLMCLVMFSLVYALRELTLAQAYAVFLAAPLIVTALAAVLLDERVDAGRWAAVGAGMCGVLVMLRPTTDGLFNLGALAALAAAVGYAGTALTLRVMTRTETSFSAVFWSLGIMAAVTGALAASDWVPVRVEHLWWLACIGLLGAIAQYLLTEAFRRAAASVVAPFEYTTLVWGMAIDWLVWSALPDARVFVGGGIVVAAGLAVIWRERAASGAALRQRAS